MQGRTKPRTVRKKAVRVGGARFGVRREVVLVKVAIEGSPEEIAALVVATQERRGQCITVSPEDPEKFKPLLEQLPLGFSPYDELDEDQEIELIEAVEGYFSRHGINAEGNGENAVGTLCADFLTWLAEEGA